jgi:hypothetical protein
VATVAEVTDLLSRRLDDAGPRLSRLDRYYEGTAPLALAAERLRTAKLSGLAGLTTNWLRLACDALSERLEVVGFRLAGSTEASEDVWNTWEEAGGSDALALALPEALLHGRSFLTVWGDEAGRPVVSAESAHQVAAFIDPAQRGARRVTAALKRWADPDAKLARATLYLPEAVYRLASERPFTDGMSLETVRNWQTVEVVRNPLGVVPVVELANRQRLMGSGESELTPGVLALQDLLGHLVSSLAVGAEAYALPRRWATGVEVPVDPETGAAIDPFGDAGPGRLYVVESEQAKLGQFPAADLAALLAAIDAATAHLLSQAAVPPHLALGAYKGQQVSAESVRAAEAGLVAKARRRQRTFAPPVEQAARLALLVRDGRLPAGAERMECVWRDPRTEAEAAQADAALKKSQVGVPWAQLMADLGYSPETVSLMRAQRRQEALDGAGVDVRALEALLP